MTLIAEGRTDIATVYLKCKVDVNKVTLFHQSDVDSYGTCGGKQ